MVMKDIGYILFIIKCICKVQVDNMCSIVVKYLLLFLVTCRSPCLPIAQSLVDAAVLSSVGLLNGVSMTELFALDNRTVNVGRTSNEHAEYSIVHTHTETLL